MIRFLLKGLLRDRHRSLFPVLVVLLGVALTVILHCWITGILGDVIDFSARFSTGHLKVITRAYAENMDQMPNDLALTDANRLIEDLQKTYPDMTWVRRIRFGGLLDVPDENGETRSQGPAAGLAVNILSREAGEIDRLNIARSLVRGSLPAKPGEVLISDEFAGKLDVDIGETVTLIGSTMFGSMAMQNFTLAGTVEFGMTVMDRGAIVVDIADAQATLDMDDAAGEILGYFNTGTYNDAAASAAAEAFNSGINTTAASTDEFAPVMLRLKEQNDLESMLDYTASITRVIVSVFVAAMSIVLWNAGLLGGLRRYGEIGVRLAIGEDKGKIYRAMICESVITGIVGSILGTAVGLGFAYLMQTKGIDVGNSMKNSSMMMPTVFRARITAQAYYIGFLPGLFATALGTALSGIGIYRRKTAQLFKELEA